MIKFFHFKFFRSYLDFDYIVDFYIIFIMILNVHCSR